MIKQFNNHTRPLTTAVASSLFVLLLGSGTAFAGGDDPAANATEPAATQGQTSQSGGVAADSMSLAAIAEEHGDISEFVEALEAAGFEESLTGNTAYTVFAPTNDALDETDGADDLMKAENRQELIGWLQAHIVADDVDPEMAGEISQAATVDGDTVTLASSGDTLTVNDVEVVDSDIQAGNLRIYAIDGVLSGDDGSLASLDADGDRDDEEEAEE
jgi:uncharacterized surface protein with fasciclin (FAS1) repeats